MNGHRGCAVWSGSVGNLPRNIRAMRGLLTMHPEPAHSCAGGWSHLDSTDTYPADRLPGCRSGRLALALPYSAYSDVFHACGSRQASSHPYLFPGRTEGMQAEGRPLPATKWIRIYAMARLKRKKPVSASKDLWALDYVSEFLGQLNPKQKRNIPSGHP